MTRQLADFRIENEKVILLSFADGGNYRVDPNELTKYLAEPDVERVQDALRLRNNFMKRILPPTAMALLVSAIIGFGSYDAYQYTHGHIPATPKTAPYVTPHIKNSSVLAQSQQTGAQPISNTAPVATNSKVVGGSSASQTRPPENSMSSDTNIKSQPLTTVAAPAGNGLPVASSLPTVLPPLQHQVTQPLVQAIPLIH